MPSKPERSWTRTLGNYSPAPRAVKNIEPSAAIFPDAATYGLRGMVMPHKTPRNPNPNIALINRRQALGALRAFGAVGAAKQLDDHIIPTAHAAATNCTLSPSLTEVPYWMDEGLNRFDSTATLRLSLASATDEIFEDGFV
jgi:hypothetical protein